jgi:cytochrome c biogenesis protein ResB
LLAAIAAASVWGSLIGSSDPERGVALARAVVFNSWWYTTLLVLLALNLALCSWQRLKTVFLQLRRFPFHRDATFYRAAETTETLRWNADPSAQVGAQTLEQIVRARFRFCRTDKTALYARKGVLSHFGSPIVHLGVIVILLGGLLRFSATKLGWAVFDGRMLIPEGESAGSFYEMKDPQKPATQDNLKEIALGFELRCLDFREEKFPGSDVPRHYVSLVEVRDGDSSFIFHIDMTNPLAYKGYRFHQMSFREDPKVKRGLVEIRNAVSGRVVADLDVSSQTPAELPGANMMIELDGLRAGDAWRIYDPQTLNTVASGTIAGATAGEVDFAVMEFLPDFRLNADGSASSASEEPQNPAAKIVVRQNAQERARGWVFQKPEFQGFSTVKDPDYEFTFLRFDLGKSPPQFEIRVTNKKSGNERGVFWLEKGEWKILAHDASSTPTAAVAKQTQNPAPPYEVRVLGPATGYDTILGVTKDPSIWFSYAGGVLLFIGIALAFLIPYRQIWAYIDAKEGKLFVALRSPRGSQRAQREFERLVNQIRNSVSSTHK